MGGSRLDGGPDSLFFAKSILFFTMYIVSENIRKKFFSFAFEALFSRMKSAQIDDFFKPKAAAKQRRADECDVGECDVGNSPGNDA